MEPESKLRAVRPEITRFEGFVAAHDSSIRSYLRARLRSRGLPADAADDLAQESFLAVWRVSRGGRDEAKLTLPYLRRVARNRVSDLGRRRRAPESLEALLGEEGAGFEPAAVTPSAAGRAAARETLATGYATIGSWRDRAAVVLSDIYGCDVSDRREILGIGTDNAVYVRVHRARREARRRRAAGE